jgi:hypothetical protein
MNIEIRFYCNTVNNCKYQKKGNAVTCIHFGFDRQKNEKLNSTYMVCENKDCIREALKEKIKEWRLYYEI